jgi:hypothetical protein
MIQMVNRLRTGIAFYSFPDKALIIGWIISAELYNDYRNTPVSVKAGLHPLCPGNSLAKILLLC